mmetsp:Transcript_850/g.1952  ORF Transcript_850/g.1952 Transcript_850/m.1952 type:complete len:152 (-) Transcript_850:2817-3272(-)
MENEKKSMHKIAQRPWSAEWLHKCVQTKLCLLDKPLQRAHFGRRLLARLAQHWLSQAKPQHEFWQCSPFVTRAPSQTRVRQMRNSEAKSPEAVNSAPAPGPRKTSGVCSGKRWDTTCTAKSAACREKGGLAAGKLLIPTDTLLASTSTSPT